jgi:hypothetical protein
MVCPFLSTCTALIRYRNESFEFPVGASTTKLHVLIFDHKTLGKDKALGEAEVDVSSKRAYLRLKAYLFYLFRSGNTSNQYPALLPKCP